MQSLAKDVHTRHLFVFFFSAKDGRTRQAEQCITPGIRLFVTPQRLLEDSSCANNEFLLLPLADVVTIRKDRKKWKLCGLASNRQLFSNSLKPVGTRWSIVSHCQIFLSQFLGTGQMPLQQTIIRFECFEPTRAMLFLNILKLVWLRWSIVTFFQWQFFGTGRLHLYLLLPFATNDNLDIEANLQYDFWIAGWLANNQQTKCRYKLFPKQFTPEVHAYNGRCWTFLIEATSRQHGMGDKPLRLSSSHSTFLSQHRNWMMGQHICSPIIHR